MKYSQERHFCPEIAGKSIPSRPLFLHNGPALPGGRQDGCGLTRPMAALRIDPRERIDLRDIVDFLILSWKGTRKWTWVLPDARRLSAHRARDWAKAAPWPWPKRASIWC